MMPDCHYCFYEGARYRNSDRLEGWWEEKEGEDDVWHDPAYTGTLRWNLDYFDVNFWVGMRSSKANVWLRLESEGEWDIPGETDPYQMEYAGWAGDKNGYLTNEYMLAVNVGEACPSWIPAGFGGHANYFDEEGYWNTCRNWHGFWWSKESANLGFWWELSDSLGDSYDESRMDIEGCDWTPDDNHFRPWWTK